jgi:metal-sulfur cluster biosynthetic enzyme
MPASKFYYQSSLPQPAPATLENSRQPPGHHILPSTELQGVYGPSCTCSCHVSCNRLCHRLCLRLLQPALTYAPSLLLTYSHVLQSDARAAGEEVLSALRRIIDPDFGEDIVSCGFVKDLSIDQASGAVGFTLELTTPACPVKDQFKREATQYVGVSGQASSVCLIASNSVKQCLLTVCIGLARVGCQQADCEQAGRQGKDAASGEQCRRRHCWHASSSRRTVMQ